ncbi:MAG TPA: SagB/ThcOx family dehydrogenase [Acidilobales archaeon]|nr:MAG: nitroreductase [Desulfurococcales archaeon ex4484_42]HDD26612.1 SagB/ThcOx family dehydrogenase [Acidilobales archaeon]
MTTYQSQATSTTIQTTSTMGTTVTSKVLSVKVGDIIKLPPPDIKSGMLVEESIARRRSIREYLRKPLNLKMVSQLLWAAQGITEPRLKFRAAPSAGATYPLEVYVASKEGGIEELPAGIYKYDPYTHSIKVVKLGDFSVRLYEAALKQRWVLEAPINIVITAVYERTTRIYGERGIRYVHMEVGHVGENIYLQAIALGLGTVAIGAFFDDKVWEILGNPPNEHPLYIMPVGYRVRK